MTAGEYTLYKSNGTDHFEQKVTAVAGKVLGFDAGLNPVMVSAVTGTGSTNSIVKFVAAGSIGDSLLSESGSTITVNGTLKSTGFQLGTSTTAGYVLTTDASGVGTWQQATGGGSLGPGTIGTIPKFLTNTTVGDSILSESGTVMTINGTLVHKGFTVTSTGPNIPSVGGNNLLDSATWTSTGWTGSYATGFTHTAGNTSALTASWTLTVGQKYILSFDMDGGGVNTVDVTCGTVINYRAVVTTLPNSIENTLGVTPTNAIGLSFTPNSAFTGRIYNIKIYLISAASTPISYLEDAEIRYPKTGVATNEDRHTICLGYKAGSYLVKDSSSVILGTGAGQYTTTSSKNVFIGYNAGQFNSGSANVAIGAEALKAVGAYTAGCVAIGSSAASKYNYGSYGAAYPIVAIGFWALGNGTVSESSVAIGTYSFGSVTSAINNTGVGSFSGQGITGASNVCIGAEAGFYIGTSTTNSSVIIGATANASQNLTNVIAIGYGATATKSNLAVLGNSSIVETWLRGNTLIGTTTGNARLYVKGVSTTSIPTFSSNLLSSVGWTATGWVESPDDVFTHTAGNTTSLTHSWTPTINTVYQIETTVTNRTTGSVTVYLDGDILMILSGNGLSSVSKFVTSTAGLSFTPTSDFNGTLSLTTVKTVSTISTPLTILDSAAGSLVDIRTNGTDNIFIGLNSGGYATISSRDNISLGNNALAAIQLGLNNVGIGTYALGTLTVGQFNTAVGAFAGNSLLRSNFNTLIGYRAAYSCTTGHNNIGVGVEPLYYNLTGMDNIAMGNYALWSTTTNESLAIGNNTLRYSTTGQRNIGIGHRVMANSTTAGFNTAIGPTALTSLTTGSYNLALGNNAGYYLTSGDYNILFGAPAGNNLVVGTKNTAIGHMSLSSSTFGTDNVAIGHNTLYYSSPTSKTISSVADYSGTVAGTVLVTSTNHGLVGTTTVILETPLYTGSKSITVVDVNTFYFTSTFLGTTTGWWYILGLGQYNTALGSSAGYSITKGSKNIFIGYNAGNNASQSATAVNSIAIGSDTYTTKDNQVIIGDANIIETVLRGTVIAPAIKLTTSPTVGYVWTCSDVDGTGAWAAATGGGLTGTGVANRIAFWTSPTNLSNNAGLLWDNTNVRIGIGITPSYKIHSAGTIAIESTGILFVRGTTRNQIIVNTTGTGYGGIQNDSDGVWSLSYCTTADVTPIGTPVLSWTRAGNVGIGYSNSAAGQPLGDHKLAVNGTILAPTIKLVTGAVVGHVWKCTNADGSGAWVAP